MHLLPPSLRRDLTSYHVKRRGPIACAECGSGDVQVRRRFLATRIAPFGGEAMLPVTFECAACGSRREGFS